jgi:hypothetical protein
MNSRLAAATVALTTVLVIASGCASTETAGAQPAERAEPVYRTGSNIRVREKTPMTKEEKEAQAEESRRALQQIQLMQGIEGLKTN